MELEGRHENLRDSREVRRLQQRTNVPTSLSIKGDVQRLDLEIFNPQLLSIYKVCYICLQSCPDVTSCSSVCYSIPASFEILKLGGTFVGTFRAVGCDSIHVHQDFKFTPPNLTQICIYGFAELDTFSRRSTKAKKISHSSG